ncbi:DNA translocase FtsK [Streptacidiphilus sp. N1-12]|uniref:DNA translocase FtsK n=2 Tax=Streptacidiphilus alkalitolerans TaxID=3342712 RepID=A0ABV6WLV3_9ACTN
MNAGELLTSVIAESITQKYNSGAGFIRLPQMVESISYGEIVDSLTVRFSDLRVADFTKSLPESDRITGHVTRAIHWRNRGYFPMLILGDLHRNRAQGLAGVPQINEVEIRYGLFRLLAANQENGVSHKAVQLFDVLRRRNIPLELVADYCVALSPLRPGSGDTARKELWRLGLLPDERFSQDINLARIQLNEQTVDIIRNADPATLQRLIAASTPSYARLRTFARQGDRELLKSLNLDEVRGALLSAQSRAGVSQEEVGEEESRTSIVDVAQSGEISVDDLLEAVRNHDGSGTLDVNGQDIEWEAVSPAEVLDDPTLTGDQPTPASVGEGFLDEDLSETSGEDWHSGFYASIAGGETAKFGTVTAWHSFSDVRTRLEDLAENAPISGRRALDALNRLIERRESLTPYMGSILAKGVELFLAFDELLSRADDLIQAWEDLWSAMGEMRAELPKREAPYVRHLANALTIVDLVIEQGERGTRARVLPLHPVVLEPRVRAATLFREMPETPDGDFLETVAANLDPAAPSLGIVVGKDPEALAFSGIAGTGEPVYGRRRLASGTPETTQVLRQVIDRFLVVHPFAVLSLCIALVEPTPEVAKRLYEQLQDPKSCAAEQITLRIYGVSNVEEIRSKLAATAAEHDDRMRVQVEIFETVPTAEALKSGGAPHLAVLFDLADSGTAGFGELFSSPHQGSVVTQWEFVTHNKTTVIKPSASGRLASLLIKQADLSSAGQVELDRSPLLSQQETDRLSYLGNAASWLVLVESTSALAAPEVIDPPESTVDLADDELERLHLLGRLGSGAHTAYVYCRDLRLLVEPPLQMMQGNSWLDPEPDSLLMFLANTVRRALPEGLLGFFGMKGALGDDAILGRVGVAAVLADLQEDEDSLVLSLDTDAARKWLQRRKSNRRADLLQLKWTDEGPLVKVIEVKATSDPLIDGNLPPQVLEDAPAQVIEMMEVLSGVFHQSERDPFAASRREILKRQVFLEALQQWEDIRRVDWAEYRRRVVRLNDLFDSSDESDLVTIQGEVVLVGIDAPDSSYPEHIGSKGLPLKVLGGDWLRQALRHGRDTVMIPASLGDLLPSLVDQVKPSDAGEQQAFDLKGADLASADVLASDAEQIDSLIPLEKAAEEQQATIVSDLLDGVEREELAHQVVSALRARNVPLRRLEAGDITVGPSVLRVPFELEPGARLAVIANQETDLARDLGVTGIRVDNLPGRARYAVLEIPRRQRSIAAVTGLSAPDGETLSVALGADFEFRPFWVPVHELPHLLIGGTTNSGKSTLLRSMLWQLTRLHSATSLDLVLIDGKGIGDFRDLARTPQIRRGSDYHVGASGALDLLAEIVEQRLPERVDDFNRYADAALSRTEPKIITDVVGLMADAAERGVEAPLRPLVIVIDEFSEISLSTSDRRRFETLVTRFVQRARAVGGHLIAATQRPSVEVVPGIMKANFARLSLRVQTAIDSRVVIDALGAERLLPYGDMLFASPGRGLVRLQGYSAAGPYPPVVEHQ